MSTLDLTPAPIPAPRRAQSLLDRVPPLPLASIAALALALFVVVQAAHGFTDPDYWWHLKTGESIVARRAIPHADVFSATAAGRPWVAHEWLSEVFIYLLVHAGGYGLALAVFTLSPVLAILLLFWLLRRAGVAALAAVPVTALSAFMVAIYGTVRPQILSWACFALLITVLYAYRFGWIRSLWLLPVLFLIWANLHLSFLIGLALLGLFVAAEAIEQRQNRQRMRLRYLAAILGCSALAACVNPNGPRLLIYPLAYLPLQSTAASVIAEWKPPDFHSYLFIPLLAALMLLLVTGCSPRRLDIWSIGLCLVAAVLALQSVRYMPIFAIAFVPAAGFALSERWGWARADTRARLSPARSLLHWTLLLSACALFVIVFRPGAWSEFQPQPRTYGQMVPVHAVDVIEELFPSARIFNQYEWGGYLIYRLWPRQRPFIDGRDDMYDPAFVREYFDAWEAKPGWEETLDRYGVNLVIVRGDASIAGALQTNPRWRLVSQDEVADVYIRTQ